MQEIIEEVTDSCASMDHKEKLYQLEKVIISELEPVELEYKHYFAHGTYTREMRVPAGSVVTGKIHKHSCINILVKGKLKVVTDEGSCELEAPYTFVSGPGVKKAAYVLEDTVWLNVHPWNGVDTLEQIEEKIIIPSTPELEYEYKKQLERVCT